MADGFQSPPNLAELAVSTRRFTVGELDAMFDAQILSRDERLELIDGVIVQMNSQMMPHGVIKFNLAHELANLLPKTLRVSTELTVRLSETTQVEPDIFVLARRPIEKRYIQGDELLIAIEVADTSLDYDLGKKASLYAMAGIPELWVIDVNQEETWIHLTPSDTGYRSVKRYAFDQQICVHLADETISLRIADMTD